MIALISIHEKYILCQLLYKITTQFATPEALIKSGMGEGAKFDSYHTKR